MRYLHPLDAGLSDVGAQPSGLQFPPIGWAVLQEWGTGYALRSASGLRAIIDCSRKEDERFWVHVSISRATRLPSHDDMCEAKQDFLGDRYAYAVYPPRSEYVNIHKFCLHLWALVDTGNGLALPEFSGEIEGVRTI